MKKLLTILCTTLLLATTSCQHEDIWDKLNDHEQRIEQLERQCRELNSNVQAIQTALIAIEQGDYVTEIMKIMENGTEVGYSITFAKSGTINIYHGTDGANGTDGATPKIGVKKASDGAYYWTTGDQWLTDDQGNKIPATVTDPNAPYITPQFRISDGAWYISYDNGNSWRAIESEEETEELFRNVTYDQSYVYMTLSDGSQFKIPYKTDSKVVDLFIFMGQSNMAGRGVAAQAPAVPEGWAYEYKAISDPGKLTHLAEPFGLNEENTTSGVDDRSSSGNRRTGTLVAAFANAYYESARVPIVTVSCSKGGTPSSYWMPGGKPLNDAIGRHNAAEEWLIENGYQIRHNFMFWLQGENDATSNVTVETYTSNMKEILKEMINKTGVERCIMIRVGKPSQSDITMADYIIQAQTELCQTYVEFVMGSTLTAGFVADGLMKDNWHYNQKGYNVLGKDVGTNVAFYVNNNIEPYMYDPHTRSIYYPISKYRSIFDATPPPASTPTSESALDLETETLTPDRQVNGYLTNKSTGELIASQQGYFYEYEIDPQWRLYATGYAAEQPSSSAAIVYFDADNRITGYETLNLSASNFRNKLLTIPARTTKVQVASSSASDKLAPVLKRANNLIDESTKIDYDVALNKEEPTLKDYPGWALAYNIPVEGGRKYYVPYGYRSWYYDKDGAPIGTLNCDVDRIDGKRYYIYLPIDATSISVSYNLTNGVTDASNTPPAIYKVINDGYIGDDVVSRTGVLFDFDFVKYRLEKYVDEGIITIPGTSGTTGLIYDEKGLGTTGTALPAALGNGVKLTHPFDISTQSWEFEVTMTVDPWTEDTGVTEALYPNIMFFSADEHDTLADGKEHGTNCFAPAIYFNAGKFSGRFDDNGNVTIGTSSISLSTDGQEHTYRWSYNKDENRNTLYKDDVAIYNAVWSRTDVPFGGTIQYLLGAHAGYPSAKNFAIKKGYHIKSMKMATVQ